MSAKSTSKWLQSAEVAALQTPFFLIDLDTIQSNLDRIALVREVTGGKVLHALKAFASSAGLAHIARQLDGAAVSSIHEATLGASYFGKNLHAYAPAYSEAHLKELLYLCSHINFNSVEQWIRFRELLKSSPQITAGLRLNPELPQSDFPMYDPSRQGSRLGVTTSALARFSKSEFEGIGSVHVHNLCEQGFIPLKNTLDTVIEKFGWLLEQANSINLGGGHLLADSSYNISGLATLCSRLRSDFGLKIYFEPGAGIVSKSGVLAAEVLDITENGGLNAIIDTSASTHMPDVLEMPYTPDILSALTLDIPLGSPLPSDENGFVYRIGGNTCLSGDHIGTYRFPEPLKIGSRIWFTDQAHYSLVKTTQFNGLKLPTVAHFSEKNGLEVSPQPDYGHYKIQLG